ncbi:MAG: ABC-type Mn2+/Zn2+ transport system ATPase subunit [Bacteriovoracaceae bacterium]|jgi:ABC-type Mn2+/Zn2+ transport system ATPase subunit
MHHVYLKKEDSFFINNTPVLGELFMVPGKVSIILGENGVGKSSFFQYLKLNQKDIFPKIKCNFTDQMRINPVNEVHFENILENLVDYKHESISFFDEYLSELKEFKERSLKNLSGGQNQIVKIFLSAYLGGDFFFFDEPLQYLDQKNRTLFKHYLKILKEKGKSICLVEHHFNLLEEYIDYRFVLTKEVDRTELKEFCGN